MHLIIRKFKTLMSLKHPVRSVISRVLSKSGLSTLFFINRNKYKLRFYPSSISRALWVMPSSRQFDEKFFQSYLRPGDVVIDVGANIGTLTLEASVIVGDSGKVFAIEAHPKTFHYLLGNIKLNQINNTFAYNVALGERDGVIVFSNNRNLDDQNSVISNSNGIEIPICCLDNLPIDEPVINLLKIDVEGYEKLVFQGGLKTLQNTECVYFESWKQLFKKYGYTCKELFEFLNNNGFQLFKMLQGNVISPISTDYTSESKENLLAFRSIEMFLQRTSFRLKDEFEA